jgi:hypothetical protein
MTHVYFINLSKPTMQNMTLKNNPSEQNGRVHDFFPHS